MAEQKKKKTNRPFIFGQTNNQCVWSRAGVAKPMLCINMFDCLECSFDRKMQANFAASAKQLADTPSDPRNVRMRMLINQRKCRHMLSGRIDYKLCGHGYDCVKCPYDQMIEDTGLNLPLHSPVIDHTSGFSVARDYYYHHGHAWARVEYAGRVRVGLDDFAQKLFGPQDAIDLPKLGATVSQGSCQAVIKRDEHQAETLSPVDGTVVALNPKLASKAPLTGKSPYSESWIMVIQPSNLKKNLKNLLFGEQSLVWIDDESSRLTSMLKNQDGQRLAASGGEAINDIFGNIPGLDWDRLVETFLR
ncbi:MAG: glycine cleavage system protein H [Desulfobacteraceae bacterium]|nr:glycine cleavage system protein H [Desulfobacteraceae bacterium]